jgi:Flp pilus assembly protein TadD
LTFFYPYPKDVSIASPSYFVPLILIIGITVASFLVIKRQRIWLSVWTYYLVTLIPVLGIVQVGTQEMADRYTYLPSIGPFLIAGLAAGLVLGKADAAGKQRTVLVRYGGVALLLLSLSPITFSQIGIWRDSITLWSSVIAKFPTRAFFAYHNRGLAFNRRGEIDRAIEDYHKAISLNPRYPDAHSNLGIALYQKGLVDQAIAEYRVAIQLDPRNANAHKNMGVALYMSSRFAEALEHYLIVATLRPDDAGAHMDLGSAYGALGDYYKAIEHFQTALRIRPDFADAHYNLATAYSMTGRMDKANDHYEKARRLNPR